MADVLAPAARAILDVLPEAALIVDADGRVCYVNAAAGELLGHRAGELDGADVASVIAAQPGQRVDVVAWLERWAADPSSPQLRYLTLTGLTRSGAQLRLSVRVARMDAEPRRYVVTMRDVTAEQREHQDVKHAYLVAARILAICDDAIVNANERQRVTFFNRAAERLFGYASAQILGAPLEQLLPYRFRAAHAQQVAAFRDAKLPARLMGERGEIVGLTRAGDEIPLEASIAKVFIDGEPTFSVQLRDIRQRKAAERARRDHEQRFRTVFDHALQAMALLDNHGTVLELNGAARALLIDASTAIGRPFWSLSWWPDSNVAGEARENAMRDVVLRCASGEEIRTRADLVGSHAEQLVLDFSLRPVRDSDGAVAAIIAEGRDITALLAT